MEGFREGALSRGLFGAGGGRRGSRAGWLVGTGVVVGGTGFREGGVGLMFGEVLGVKEG